MPSGRCAGCGLTDAPTKVKQHVLSCPGYLRLYREHPDRCLDPVAEFTRYKDEDDNREARAERRDNRMAGRAAEMERRAVVAAQRLARPKDILED